MQYFGADTFLLAITTLSLGAVSYLYYRLLTMNADIRILSDITRLLIRTGKVTPGTNFKHKTIQQIWRKILSFYGGVSRNVKIKSESDIVISHALELLKKSHNSEQILRTLTDIVRKACAPDSLFVSVIQKAETKTNWFVSVASGISIGRLEDPLAIAMESLPLEADRTFVYTSPQNGSEFDFTGLGVGLSVFVPMHDSKPLTKVLWIGFKQSVGLLDENRRNIIELIIEHALVMYRSSLQSEEVIEKNNQQKDQVLSLTHDLKSPSIRALYALREYVQDEGALGVRDNTLLLEVEYALEEQLGLINELFSTGVGGVTTHDSLVPVEFDVCSLIQSRVDSFSVIARSVSLELQNKADVRVKVKMPKLVFNRILDNLISNAIKYTSTGTIRITTNVVGQKVTISVHDTGSGVREDLVPFLFTSTMKNQKRLENSGYGYGLAVSKNLVEDWGGSMGYRRSDDRGSIFHFTLPIVSSARRAILDLNDPTVLLIDDDASISKVHARWIQSSGAKVVIASSFSEAVSMVEMVEPNVIISDLHIPGEDFYSFITKVPQGIPAILLTADSSSYILSTIRELSNVVTILEKPLLKAELMKAVENVFNTRDGLGSHEKAA